MVEKANESKHGAVFEGILENAEVGKVITRFPPEPSGYLHIGHIKAVILNRHLADIYQGKMLVRFDDTNPEKESLEFVDNILNDLRTAKIEWHGEHTFVTDHFEFFEEVMTDLIKRGLCYCDNTPSEIMREQRDKGIPSSCRDKSIDENLEIWTQMRNKNIEADSPIKKYCVRAKTDNPKDKNKCMRDPVFYRFCESAHYRLGTTYKLYPMYDFTCPIIDHKDGVTHMMRTNEYADRIPMYRWIEKACNLPTMNIYEYSRLNMVHTVLSKRSLKWFVEKGHVEGWDDPRFPTLRGILRRGVKIEAIKDFILQIGPSKNTNMMKWDKLYTINKDYIDPTAKRLFGVSSENPVLVELENFDEKDAETNVDWHPKNKEIGTRIQLRSNKLFIEIEDAKDLAIDMKLTLYKWGNSKVTHIEKNELGEIIRVVLRLTPEDLDFKKTKVAHWVSAKEDHTVKVRMLEFDHLITKEKVEDTDKIEDLVNLNSKIETILLVEKAVEQIKQGESIQLERRGYFYVDSISDGNNLTTINFIPDGRSNTMSVVKTKVDPKLLVQGKDDKKSKKQEARETKKEKVEKVLTEEDKQKAKEAKEKKLREAEEKKKQQENSANPNN